MAAFFGKGQTPESAVLKGDHLVGKYYVEFDKHYKAEQADLVAKGMSQEEAAKQAPIFLKHKKCSASGRLKTLLSMRFGNR